MPQNNQTLLEKTVADQWQTLPSGLTLDGNMFLVCGVCAVLSMVVGLWVFRKTQDRFVLHI